MQPFTGDFLSWIEQVDQKIIEKNNYLLHDEKRILARTVKLTEEVGELSEAILSYCHDQRDEKLAIFRKENLDDELADVIITTLVLARSVKSDINIAIVSKIEKIIKRGGI